MTQNYYFIGRKFPLSLATAVGTVQPYSVNRVHICMSNECTKFKCVRAPKWATHFLLQPLALYALLVSFFCPSCIIQVLYLLLTLYALLVPILLYQLHYLGHCICMHFYYLYQYTTHYFTCFYLLFLPGVVGKCSGKCSVNYST